MEEPVGRWRQRVMSTATALTISPSEPPSWTIRRSVKAGRCLPQFRPRGPSPFPDWSFEGNAEYVFLGWDVASAGDVNGDGYGDLVVGAPGHGDLDEGRAYLFFGSSSDLFNPVWTYESDQEDSGFGESVASAGDVNGDGYGDVVIGAPYFTVGQIEEGAAYGFYGGPAGLTSTPNWFIQTNRIGANYGYPVAGIGDVNGDGYSDVAVGASFDTTAKQRGLALCLSRIAGRLVHHREPCSRAKHSQRRIWICSRRCVTQWRRLPRQVVDPPFVGTRHLTVGLPLPWLVNRRSNRACMVY